MKLTEEQLDQYGFEKQYDDVYQCWVEWMVFIYYPPLEKLTLGMEGGDGEHCIQDLEEFVTLYKIFKK